MLFGARERFCDLEPKTEPRQRKGGRGCSRIIHFGNPAEILNTMHYMKVSDVDVYETE
jgi:hypothetical protein